MQRKNWKVLEEEIIHSTCWNCNSHKGLSYAIPPKSYRFSIKVPGYTKVSFLGHRRTESYIETIYFPTWHEILVKLKIRKEGITCYCFDCGKYGIVCKKCRETNPINALKQICIHCGRKIYFPRRYEG